jgi:hypothetical protein
MAAETARINPEEARRHLQSGDALLVCAYDDEEKCRKNHLEGAISMSEFRRQENQVPKEREIIFYCA